MSQISKQFGGETTASLEQDSNPLEELIQTQDIAENCCNHPEKNWSTLESALKDCDFWIFDGVSQT